MFGDSNKQLLLERIQEKDALIYAMGRGMVVVIVLAFSISFLFVKQMQLLVDEKERALTKSEAESITARSRFQAEWNLRPLLETKVTEFFIRNKFLVPHGGQQKLDAYRHFSHNRQHFQNHLARAMSCNGVASSDTKAINKEFESLYSTLSKRHHLGDTPDGVVGYVVNHDKYFATAVSAFLMSLNLPHTVMTGNCEKVRYKWPLSVPAAAGGGI